MAHSLDRRTFLTSVGLASTGLAAFSTFAAEKVSPSVDVTGRMAMHSSPLQAGAAA